MWANDQKSMAEVVLTCQKHIKSILVLALIVVSVGIAFLVSLTQYGLAQCPDASFMLDPNYCLEETIDIVNISTFDDGFMFTSQMEDMDWWDVNGRKQKFKITVQTIPLVNQFIK